MSRIVVISVLFVFLLSACNKEKRLLKDLNKKEWSIETSKRWVIYNDGSTLLYEDLTDAGTIYIYNDPTSVLEFKEIRMVYTNYLGFKIDFTTPLYANKDGTRIDMAGALCNSPFECDLVWNVEESSNRKQTWSSFGSNDTFFFPPDVYNANQEHHLKWEITLKKVGKYTVE